MDERLQLGEQQPAVQALRVGRIPLQTTPARLQSQGQSQSRSPSSVVQRLLPFTGELRAARPRGRLTVPCAVDGRTPVSLATPIEQSHVLHAVILQKIQNVFKSN